MWWARYKVNKFFPTNMQLEIDKYIYKYNKEDKLPKMNLRRQKLDLNEENDILLKDIKQDLKLERQLFLY